jgi:hypothetical protein
MGLKLALVLILVLGWATQVSAQNRLTNGLIIAAGTSAFGDAVTTAWGRGAGLDERNPAMRWATDKPVRWALVKGGTDAVIVYTLLRHRGRHQRAVRALAIGVTALNVTLTVHNVRQINAIEQSRY